MSTFISKDIYEWQPLGTHPPFTGWWNASARGDTSVWRWWDGASRTWSKEARDGALACAAAERAAKPASFQHRIRWRWWYPADARVPRLAHYGPDPLRDWPFPLQSQIVNLYNEDKYMPLTLARNNQDALMVYAPDDGVPHPYPSHAEQWRDYHGPTAWLFNPWTGVRRDARDVGTDVLGRLIVAPTK